LKQVQTLQRVLEAIANPSASTESAYDAIMACKKAQIQAHMMFVQCKAVSVSA